MASSGTNGRICYLELPAADAERSAEFYSRVFGWQIRRRASGQIAFDDSTGQVSGTFLSGALPDANPRSLLYIMVDDMEATLAEIVDAGGEIAQPVGAHLPEITARFRDPAGNVLGLYQEHQHPAPRA